jgi:hypothetical protein
MGESKQFSGVQAVIRVTLSRRSSGPKWVTCPPAPIATACQANSAAAVIPLSWHVKDSVQFCVVAGCGCVHLILAVPDLDTATAGEFKQVSSVRGHE